METDDDTILSVCQFLRTQDVINLSSTCTRLKELAQRDLSTRTKLLIYKKSPISNWSDNDKDHGETSVYKSLPLHSVVLDVSKCPKDFALLLNKMPKIDSITFGVYTVITKSVIEVINGKLSQKVSSMSFDFPFGLHGKRLAQLNIQNLTNLRVRYAGLTEPDLKLIVTKCSKLEFLDVTGNWYISGHCFRECNVKIKSLLISRCSGFKYDGIESLVEGAGKNLELLEIDFLGSVEKIEPELYLICSILISLKSFKLRASSFHERDSSYIRWLKNLKSLTIIELGPMLNNQSLITILKSCSKISHLHLDICYGRGKISDTSLKMVPHLLPLLTGFKLKNVKILDQDLYTDYAELNLQKIHLERCGEIPIQAVANCADVVKIVLESCSDVPKIFNDCLTVANQNPKKLYKVKVTSIENFEVSKELPRNLRFIFVRKFE